MLAIDITLRAIDTVASVADNVSALGIDFSGLQTLYISLKNPESTSTLSSSNSHKRNLDSLTSINTGRGSFAIIGESAQIMKDIYESSVSVKISVLGESNGSPLSEYASGTLENIPLNDHTKEKTLDHRGLREDIVDIFSDKILSQKMDVFGGAAIVAFYPEIVVELIHSVGVGSSAGAVTISITMIDTSKVSKSKIIGATGRIVQDMNFIIDKETDHTGNNEEPYFDMEGFLNQKKSTEVLSKENSSQDSSETLSECPPIAPIVDDKYESSDSEGSISIDNFLSSLREKREMMEKNQINSDTALPRPVQKDFKYNIIERTSREKYLSSGVRGSMILRNGGDDIGDWPPIAVTQNGTRVLGVQGHVQEERQRRQLGQMGGLKSSLTEIIPKNVNEICNQKSMKAHSNRNEKEIKDGMNVLHSDFWLSNAINDVICMKKRSEQKEMTANDKHSFLEMERDMYCAKPDTLDGILLLASEQKLQSSNINIIMNNCKDDNFLTHKKIRDDRKDDSNRKGGKKKKPVKKKEISNESNKTFVDDTNTEYIKKCDESGAMGLDYNKPLVVGNDNPAVLQQCNPVVLQQCNPVVLKQCNPVVLEHYNPVVLEHENLPETKMGSLQLGPADISDTRNLSSTSTSSSSLSSSSTTHKEEGIDRTEIIVDNGDLDSTGRGKRQSRIIPKVFSFHL